MEREVFTLPEVEALMEEFVIASVVTDIGDEKANAVWKKYRPEGGGGVPHYVVLDADGEVQRRIGATLKDPNQFIAFLKGESVEESTPVVVEPKGTPKAVEGWPEGLPPAQSPDTNEAFDFTAVFSASAIQPGGEVTLELRFKMKSRDSGPFYLYHPDSPHSKALDMSLFILNLVEDGGLVPAGEWEFPKHKVLPANDPANYFDHDEWKFYGEFTVVRRFKVPEKQGDYRIAGTLAGQYCDSQGCIWFEDLNQTPFGWVASVKVDESGAASAVVPPKTDGGKSNGASGTVGPDKTTTTTEETEEEKDSFLWILIIAFFGGMVTLLTPCVLPVLPLTVSFFVKQAEHKRSPFITAFIYCTCIVASFTLFGLITSLALGDQGAQIIATNPWVNVAIGVLFLVFALSFFGMFELRAPAFITGWISKKQMKTQQAGNGYATALLSGGSFAVISFSCSGPIAATFLAEAAQGSFWTPTFAMLFFASGMALPIFIMGLFPSLLKKLPKSGGWMNALKVVFAFIEIAVAIRYFSWAEIAFTSTPVPVIFSRELVDAFWIACSVGAGLYLLGVFRMPHDHEDVKQIGVVRLLFALGFLGFAVYLLPGMVRGAPMGLLDGFLPPREVVSHSGGSNGGGGVDVHSLHWHQDLDEALAEAKKTNKPVFVDFTGVICSNCRWVETNIFPKPPVASRLASDYVLVQQWTDTKDQKAKDYYNKYGKGGKGVPMYVILKPDGTMVEKFVPPQFINSLTAEEFAEFMDKGKAKVTGQ
ncbi:MAG: thioredoxin family protein [Planctomycetes bacterium]|nr:thioredoxin family protein [Planctomycetota bacterium]